MRAIVEFLKRVFQRLLTNFTWWVNRKDPDGRNLFQGGFLGLDNIGVFDRSAPLPGRRHARAGRRHGLDGVLLPERCSRSRSSWPARPRLRGHGRQVRAALRVDRRRHEPARRRRAVGRGGRLLLRRDAAAGRQHAAAARCARWSACCRCAPRPCSSPSCSSACRISDAVRASSSSAVRATSIPALAQRPGPSVGGSACCRSSASSGCGGSSRHARRVRVPRPARHPRDLALPRRAPVRLRHRRAGVTASTTSRPSRDTGMFGGNSNWRGPVWFPMNMVILRGLLPAARVLRRRPQGRVPDRFGQRDEPARGRRARSAAAWPRSSCAARTAAGPCSAGSSSSRPIPHWHDLLLFHEYFHGDNGAGLGASHQTGWTGLVALLLPLSGMRERRSAVSTPTEAP